MSKSGRPGKSYVIGGDCCIENLELLRQLCDALDQLTPRRGGSHAEAIVHVDDRPGHDRHYQIDHSKMTATFGWRPRMNLTEGLRDTVRWYLDNKRWLTMAQSRGYKGERLGLGRAVEPR